MANTPKQIEWAIKEIKELEFMVNEFLDLGPSFDFGYTTEIMPIAAEETLRITVTANYSKTETKEVFLKGKVTTVYLIKDLKSTAKATDNDTEAIDLPEPLWVALFSIAFTHTRAILARSSAGTKFGNMLLPAINPEIEFKKLFGHLLPSTTS